MTDRYNTPPLPKTIPELVSFMWDVLAVRAKSFEQDWVRLYLKEKGVCFEHRKAVIKAMVAGIKEHEVAECPCCTDHVKCRDCGGTGWNWDKTGRCLVCSGSGKVPVKGEEKRLYCHAGEERKDCAWRILPQDYCTVSCSGCKYRSALPKVKPVVDETIYCHSTEACGMRRTNSVCGPGKTVGCPGQKTGVPYPMDKQLEREKNLDNAEEYRAMLELKTRQLKRMYGFIKRPDDSTVRLFLGQFAEDLLKLADKFEDKPKV
jgi:hypothetical protein